jgi:hypothetical protein
MFVTTLTITLMLVPAAAQTPSFHGLGQMPGVWPAAGTRYSVRLQFARLEAVCFRRGRERVQPRILVQPLVVSKVYPPDQHIRRFLGQWIHTLAAAAGNPFLTTES